MPIRTLSPPLRFTPRSRTLEPPGCANEGSPRRHCCGQTSMIQVSSGFLLPPVLRQYLPVVFAHLLDIISCHHALQVDVPALGLILPSAGTTSVSNRRITGAPPDRLLRHYDSHGTPHPLVRSPPPGSSCSRRVACIHGRITTAPKPPVTSLLCHRK
jgi:hypothetical protein